ncbi:post-transcriptional regulator [Caldalkalibacillus mannanilyticus]|uniref:post-transcriptional regulator n=1 Tax=Caldalkalibacillus mannanilyticus TaxID=1418 RepID=UPI000468EBF1|nr:post-transcriptional regulator [Caldalkalibacillus mannanilyticus]
MESQRQLELKKKIFEVLQSKMEEFHMLGYDAVTTDDIWLCVTSKYKKEWPQLSKVVNDIYSLKPTMFMNWLTMQAMQGKLT